MHELFSKSDRSIVSRSLHGMCTGQAMNPKSCYRNIYILRKHSRSGDAEYYLDIQRALRGTKCIVKVFLLRLEILRWSLIHRRPFDFAFVGTQTMLFTSEPQNKTQLFRML